MSYLLVFLAILSCSFIYGNASAGKAVCRDPYYGKCYGIPHSCPHSCPQLCEVDCKTCKPYCACDKPGAVCQDPRFIGGDGIMFYFHGKKNKDFCLVSDPDIHINGHFIGKKGKKGRDFTWVQSIGVLFGSHQLFVGARDVAKWDESEDNMHIQLDGIDISIPSGEGEMWWSSEAGLRISRATEVNLMIVEVAGLFKMRARVVPITPEESRVHGYDVKNDCFAHLDLSFKFSSLSGGVDGVLGQTYSPKYRSRVKMGAPMPIMGGADKFGSSHIFGTDCAVSKFGLKRDGLELEDPPRVACGARNGGGQGIVCKGKKEMRMDYSMASNKNLL